MSVGCFKQFSNLRSVHVKSPRLSSSNTVDLFYLQGLLLCPQTLSQTRRNRLRRAFTEATGDTVTYVKTVGSKPLNYALTKLSSTVQSPRMNIY